MKFKSVFGIALGLTICLKYVKHEMYKGSMLYVSRPLRVGTKTETIYLFQFLHLFKLWGLIRVIYVWAWWILAHIVTDGVKLMKY